MTPQELQIVSDLLKVAVPVIGTLLGAVIGAYSAYKIGTMNAEKAMKLSAENKRFDLIVEVADALTQFHDRADRYFLAVRHRTDDRFVSLGLKDAKDEMFSATQQLRRARALLQLCGYREENERLQSYADAFNSVWAQELTINDEQVLEHRRVMTESLREVNAMLSRRFPLSPGRLAIALVARVKSPALCFCVRCRCVPNHALQATPASGRA